MTELTLDTWVCGTCGVPIAKNERTQKVFHIDAIPEDVEEHDAFPWVTRREYLFGESQAAQQRVAGSPGERSAAALERIAAAAERIAAVLDT